MVRGPDLKIPHRCHQVKEEGQERDSAIAPNV